MYIGIDVGGTNIDIGVIDSKGNIIEKITLSTDTQKSFDNILKQIIKSIKKLLNTKKIDLSQIKSVGMGLPGVVDVNNGILVWSPNLNAYNYNIIQFLENELNIPAFIENDANCALLAESIYGSIKNYNNAILITIGTGIGTGILIDKKIYRGNYNSAGEFGHMIININGRTCSCGRNGCWEQYASASALTKMIFNVCQQRDTMINELVDYNEKEISPKVLFQALEQDDEVAKQIFNEYIKYVGEGILNIINILSPEAIAIGGSISEQKHKLINPLKKYIHDNSYNKSKIPYIPYAKLERTAGIIGAAMLSKHQ